MFDSPLRDQTRPENADHDKPDELDAARLLSSLRELPAFQTAPTADTALGLLLQRMEQLRKTLHEFCQQNQLREGCLSKAMIRGRQRMECPAAPTRFGPTGVGIAMRTENVPGPSLDQLADEAAQGQRPDPCQGSSCTW